MTSHQRVYIRARFYRNLITGDEKLVLYINCAHRRQWLSAGQTGVTIPTTDRHSKKVMLSVWWEVKGTIHWEILATGYTTTTDLYYQQLNRVAEKLKGKQDRI